MPWCNLYSREADQPLCPACVDDARHEVAAYEDRQHGFWPAWEGLEIERLEGWLTETERRAEWVEN